MWETYRQSQLILLPTGMGSITQPTNESFRGIWSREVQRTRRCMRGMQTTSIGAYTNDQLHNISVAYCKLERRRSIQAGSSHVGAWQPPTTTERQMWVAIMLADNCESETNWKVYRGTTNIHKNISDFYHLDFRCAYVSLNKTKQIQTNILVYFQPQNGISKLTTFYTY